MNRLDEIVFYKPLTRDEIGKIIDLMMSELNRRLADRQLTVSLTPAAKALIAEIGYDPVFGARPAPVAAAPRRDADQPHAHRR